MGNTILKDPHLEGKTLLGNTMLKEQLENITVEEYDVEKLYKKSGVMHRIAKDPFFNNGTLLIIFLNSLWIGSD